MLTDNKNLILAIVLSLVVLLGWQYFVAGPQIAKQQQIAEQQQAATSAAQPDAGAAPGTAAPAAVPGAAPTSVAAPQPAMSRADALALSPRVPIETASISGSVNLKGGRIDDVRLNDFRETVDPTSPTIVLLSPSSGPDGYFAEFGWIGDAKSGAAPGPDTLWTAPAGAKLTVATPVTLTYDNGAGLVFTRTIAIDDKYMFTVTDGVTNAGTAPVSLTPYGRLTRLGEPHVAGYYILHEGFIGAFGDASMSTGTVKYKELKDKPSIPMPKADRGWLGMTDKYWAAILVPEKGRTFEATYSRSEQPTLLYQADFRQDPVSVAPGAKAATQSRLFAGAKQVAVVDGYQKSLGIERFELLIDWGWFYFITKPMFFAIDWFFRLFGNFGLAILAVTVCVKLAFFPLANKSYKSMSAMKKMQPQMMELRERFKDDKVKQQQALMELYKKEKINPLAGCWPVALQIPVFFSLYKVLFVTIEMRHAPFFGWIRDLSAPDPTNLFTLFGLVQWDPSSLPVIGHFLVIGIWPLIMGVTMFVQMRLNPTPADPTQQLIFTWMPVIFTFMLASFPAGLVIYWAWNNTLSVTQQYVIMRRQGVQVDLWGNITSTFRKKPKPLPGAADKPAGAKAIAAPVAANDSDAPVRAASRAKAKRVPKPKAKPSSADASG